MANTVNLTSINFDQVISTEAGDRPVLVDLWAPWCGPCKQIAPIIEELGTDLAGRAVIAKVNVDEHPSITARYKVMSVPTLLVFHRGELVNMITGAKPKSAIVAALTPYLPAAVAA